MRGRSVGLIGLGALMALAGVFGGSLVEGRARAQDATGKVAGWVFWGWCPSYGVMGAPGAAAPGEAQPGAQAQPGGETRPSGPTVIYPQPGPVPAVGALVALQGTSLTAKADEEGFFLIENVPLGVYYTAAASFPRRRPGPAAAAEVESGRPAAPTVAPVVCAAGSASRANVVVSDPNRPTFIGALIVGWVGPRPLTPGQPVPQEGVEGGPSD